MNEAAQPEQAELGPLPSEKIIALRDALEDHQIPYAFGGAVALFYYRDPRSTIDIDLFFADTDFHDSMARRVQRYPFLDGEINVLSAEDLLICKVLFDRGKDWLDIEAVAKTRLREIDTAYITDWLSRFLPPDDPRRARIKAILG